MEEDTFYKKIGENIKKQRLKYNEEIGKMTQEMLAEKINVSVSFISALESKNTHQGISITTLYKISVALNTPIHKFFEGVENE